MKIFNLFLLALVTLVCCKPSNDKKSETKQEIVNTNQKDSLIYSDNFSNDLSNYILEFPDTPESKVEILDGKLVVDVNGGTTVWLNKKLKGDIRIEYYRKVIVDNGINDRLSDLNQFWMASDPRNNNLFTRSGLFHEYDSLSLYYFGFGGNTNTTTRFRKYTGDGRRVLIHDLKEQKFLLEANKTYKIEIVVYKGTTKVLIDGQEFSLFTDPEPLKEGYFGFRTTESRQEIDDLKIYSLK
jgi:rhamnogalacturonan endolyase